MQSIHQLPQRIANAFLVRLSTLLVLFGIALTGVGLAVQLARAFQMASIETSAAAPPFELSLAFSAPSATSTAAAEAFSVSAARARAPLAAARATPGAPRATSTPKPTPTATPLGAPDMLYIPSLKLVTKVVPVGWEARVVNGTFKGNQWVTADFAAGWHSNSALLGEEGNTVLSGHNNIFGKVFAKLHEVKVGDLVILSSGPAQRVYKIDQNFIVREVGSSLAQREENARWIDYTPDERVTLVTCYPPWSNTHRTIVTAHPLPEYEQRAFQEQQRQSTKQEQ